MRSAITARPDLILYVSKLSANVAFLSYSPKYFSVKFTCAIHRQRKVSHSREKVLSNARSADETPSNVGVTTIDAYLPRAFSIFVERFVGATQQIKGLSEARNYLARINHRVQGKTRRKKRVEEKNLRRKTRLTQRDYALSPRKVCPFERGGVDDGEISLTRG